MRSPCEEQLAAAAFLARYSGRTLDAYRFDLRCCFQWATDHGVDVSAATRAHIEFYRSSMEQRQLAASTIDRRLSTVCGYFKFAHIDGRIDANPAQYVRRPNVQLADRHGIDRGELGRFLFTAEHYDHAHAAPAVLLGLNGLRVSEACDTNIADLGFERGRRMLRITGNGNKPAMIPLVPRTARTIDLAVGERYEGPVLVRRAGACTPARRTPSLAAGVSEVAVPGVGRGPSRGGSTMTRSRFSRLVAVSTVTAAALGTVGTFGTAAAAPGGDDLGSPVDVAFGESDAESILLLHAYYPGYWWDHADLTIAVLNAPNVDDENYDAIREAIETWSEVLAEEFEGAITLTDVTETARNPQRADIVVHYVPHAGGSQWGGYAVCGAQRCNNVIVRSDVPDLIDVGVPDYDPQRVYRVALHEIGHALGLGHAEPLEATNDLMGYGWSVPEPDTTPVLSQCDLDALRYEVFAWVFEGVDPYPSTAPEYVCDATG